VEHMALTAHPKTKPKKTRQTKNTKTPFALSALLPWKAWIFFQEHNESHDIINNCTSGDNLHIFVYLPSNQPLYKEDSYIGTRKVEIWCSKNLCNKTWSRKREK